MIQGPLRARDICISCQVHEEGWWMPVGQAKAGVEIFLCRGVVRRMCGGMVELVGAN